jgi:hypothetical protein
MALCVAAFSLVQRSTSNRHICMAWWQRPSAEPTAPPASSTPSSSVSPRVARVWQRPMAGVAQIGQAACGGVSTAARAREWQRPATSPESCVSQAPAPKRRKVNESNSPHEPVGVVPRARAWQRPAANAEPSQPQATSPTRRRVQDACSASGAVGAVPQAHRA